MNTHAFSSDDVQFMYMAIAEAKKAAENGDVPVGAVLVRNGEAIAYGHNTREIECTVIGHAEINAISEACRVLHSRRLSDCTLYVTLEPCPMCTGAILGGRIGRVVCGTKDPTAGAMGSVWSLHTHPIQTVSVQVEYGCMEDECRDLLQTFFRDKRR